MGMVVQHNLTSMNANRNLGVSCGALSKSTEKLSSGYKINRAGDNAAGLAISEKMRGQIRGLNQASANSEDGISMIQTAEGALTETHSILQRMRELAVQAASDTNTDDDRTQIQNEIDQLTQEVDRIATTTEFNTKKLLDGSRQGSVTEKAGKASVEGTFGNSNVSAEITTNGAAKAAFTDVIRVEITKDFEAGMSTASKSKLTDTDTAAIYKMLTTVSAAVTVGKTSDGNAVAVNTPGTVASTKSTEENLEIIKTTVETEIDSAKTAATTASGYVASNADLASSIAKSLISQSASMESANSGNAILVDGVTEEDLTKAVSALIDAYTEAGKVAANAANGDTVAITNAKNEFSALLKKGATAIAGTYAANAVTIGTATDGAGTTTSQKNAVWTGQDFDTISGDILGKVELLAKDAAGASIMSDLAEEKVTVLEDVAKNLEDTDLVNAIVNYEKVKNANAAVAGESKELAAEKQANIDAAKATLDKYNTASSVLTVTDLFGNSDDTKKFEIGSKVDDDNKLTITLKNKEGDDTVITINNADKLKAGDVITITSEKMVESKQAATGKEAFRLQVGANAGQEVALGINSMKAKDLEIVQTKEGVEGQALDVTNQASASLAVNAFDMAIQKVSTERAKMGAMQNRLEHTIANLDTSAENLQSAESSLRDTDMAEEMTNYSKNNILMQAGQSMLAHANQSNQGVLSLLQ